MRIRKSRRLFSSTLVFRDALKNASLNVVLVGTRWQAPAIVVRTTKLFGICVINAVKLATRAALISALGEALSKGRQSQAGKT